MNGNDGCQCAMVIYSALPFSLQPTHRHIGHKHKHNATIDESIVAEKNKFMFDPVRCIIICGMNTVSTTRNGRTNKRTIASDQIELFANRVLCNNSGLEKWVVVFSHLSSAAADVAADAATLFLL